MATLTSKMPPFEMKGETKTWRLQRIKVLGKGSFGLATLVKCVDTEELYVAKEMNLQMIKKTEELEGLHKEIAILKQVKHPNVVKYVDSSSDESSFMLTILMEYCDGGDLHERIKSLGDRGMSESEVASMMVQILMALRCLHMEHRILHRDLKPQNIFLTKDGEVKLGDFGVSTVLTQSIDFAKTFCGSPYYLAPELCEEKPYNGKADMWSVGVILYECMAKGVRPFPAKNLVSLVMQITKANYDDTPLKAYNSELSEIVSSLLQRLPVNRPTFARLMRLPYIRDNLYVLPRSLLASPEYSSALGNKMVQRALGVKESGGVAPVGGRKPSAISDELAKWAEQDKKTLGGGERVVDPEFMTERQKRELQGTTSSSSGLTSQHGSSSEHLVPKAGGGNVNLKAPTSSSTAPTAIGSTVATMIQKQGSATLDDDETWNSKYEDDEFEEMDDEENEKKELAMNDDWQISSFVPMTEQSFHFN